MTGSKEINISTIEYPGYGKFKIHGGSKILKFRANSFLTKEPTTLEWLQSMEPTALLIDVGANIGIYSIPAALYHVKKVIAIEPEIKNYNMLLENLEMNDISSEKCEAIPVAVSTQFMNKRTKLYLTIDEAGSSCHQVGNNQDFKLRPLRQKRKYRNIFCVSLSQLVEQACESHEGPIHIKIDVDGIEADVCQSLFDDRLTSLISSFQIELNNAIKEHRDLIMTLRCLGFDFDPLQIQKSCRRQGVFKGYAEYVFRRSLPENVISKLPAEIRQRIGSQLIGSGVQVDQSLSSYFPAKRGFKMIKVGRLPAAFIVKSFFDFGKCSNLFHALALKSLSSPNKSFKGQELRYKISLKHISLLAPNYIKELEALALDPKFLDLLANAVRVSVKSVWGSFADSDEINKRLIGKKLACRVRHFVDLYGYSLARHHDSADTLCAVIVPILPYSTTTSIVTGSLTNRKYLSDVDFSSLFRNAFASNSFYSANDSHPKTYSLFSQEKRIDSSGVSRLNWVHKESPYSFSQVDMGPGEALILPNAMCKLVALEGSTERQVAQSLMNHCGHGVLPCVTDVYRPVLLMDYVLVSSNDSLESSESVDLLIDIGDALKFSRKIINHGLG